MNFWLAQLAMTLAYILLSACQPMTRATEATNQRQVEIDPRQLNLNDFDFTEVQGGRTSIAYFLGGIKCLEEINENKTSFKNVRDVHTAMGICADMFERSSNEGSPFGAGAFGDFNYGAYFLPKSPFKEFATAEIRRKTIKALRMASMYKDEAFNKSREQLAKLGEDPPTPVFNVGRARRINSMTGVATSQGVDWADLLALGVVSYSNGLARGFNQIQAAPAIKNGDYSGTYTTDCKEWSGKISCETRRSY